MKECEQFTRTGQLLNDLNALEDFLETVVDKKWRKTCRTAITEISRHSESWEELRCCIESVSQKLPPKEKKAEKEKDKNGTRARTAVARAAQELQKQSSSQKVKITIDVDPVGML